MSYRRLLRAERLSAGYDRKIILRDVSFEVGEGEVVAVIGHNGAGKSTLLKALYGVVPLLGGSLYLDGQPFQADPVHWLRNGGIFIPQGGRVFGDMTVRDNLRAGFIGVLQADGSEDSLRESLVMFPRLLNRLGQNASSLSGGERQMLALARAFLGMPKLLLLDEPSLGLSPDLVSDTLRRVIELCRSKRISTLIVEQRVREVVAISDRVIILKSGQVTFDGFAAELRDEKALLRFYL